MRIHGINWSFFLSPFWTVGFILVSVGIVLLAFYLDACYVSRQKWYCPSCNKVFITKWYWCLPALHVGNDYLLRCPHCGNKNLCWKAEHSSIEEEDKNECSTDY